MVEGRLKKIASDTAWLAVSSFGSRILSLLLVPLYTIVLTTSEYGKIDILNTTIDLLLPFLSFVIWEAVFRFVMDKEYEPKDVFTGGVITIFFSSIILLFTYPVTEYALNSVTKYWWFYWWIFVTNGFVNLITSFFRGIDKVNICAVQGVIYTALFSIFNVILLLYFEIGICGYFTSQIIGNVVAIAYMLYMGKAYVFFSLSSFKIRTLLDMIKYSLPLVPAAVAWWVVSSIDKYMLLYMCGESANGLYAVAHKIPTILTTITSFFISAWQISAVKNKDADDSEEFMSSMYTNLIYVCVFVAFILIIISKTMTEIIFAREYFSSWNMVPGLIIGAVFSTCSGFIGAQFTAYKRSDLHFISNVIAMISNILFNYPLIFVFGSKGVALGTMCSFFVVLIYRQYKLKLLQKVFYNEKKIYMIFAILIVSSIISTLDLKNWIFYEIVLLMIIFSFNYYEIKILILKLFSLRK